MQTEKHFFDDWGITENNLVRNDDRVWNDWTQYYIVMSATREPANNSWHFREAINSKQFILFELSIFFYCQNNVDCRRFTTTLLRTQHYYLFAQPKHRLHNVYYLGMISNLLLHATPNVIFSPANFFNCEMLWSVFIPKYILVIIETALLLKKQFLCIIHSNFFVYCTYVLRGNKETSTFRKITAVFRDTSHYRLFNFMLYQSVILTIVSWNGTSNIFEYT